MAGISNRACAVWCLLGAGALISCGSDAPGGDSTAGAAGVPVAGAAGSSGNAGAHSGNAGTAGLATAGSGANSGSSGSSTSGTGGEAGEPAGGEAGEPAGGSSGTSGGGTGGTSGGGTGGKSGGGAGGTSGGGTSGAGAGGTSGGGAGGSAGAPTTLGPAPVGLVTFYQGTSTVCPSGWTRLANADGRLLLATSVGTQNNQQVGAALGNHEDRFHTHAFNVQLPLGIHGVSSAGGNNSSAAASGNFALAGTLSPSPSGLPYSQLLVCKLTSDLGQGDGFPVASVAHFDKASCPSGWEAYAAANNRIIIAAPGTSGTVAGNMAHHQHPLDISMSLGTVSLATAAGNAQTVASAGVVTVSTMSDPGNDGVDQPTLSLLACRKTAAAEATATVPSGALSFLDADSCPVQWQRYTDHEGRFILGANAGIGDTFGGGSLGQGENRMHTHQYTNSVLLPPQPLAAAAGTGFTAGASGTHTYQINVQAASVSPPRLELRQCRKQ